MRRVLRQWRWFLLGGILVAVGWLVAITSGFHAREPTEPRWSVLLQHMGYRADGLWSLDGKTLWTISGADLGKWGIWSRGPLQQWDVLTGQELACLGGDDSLYYGTAVSSDGQYFAGLKWFEEAFHLHLIDLHAKDESLLTLFHGRGIHSDLFFSPAGDLLFVRPPANEDDPPAQTTVVDTSARKIVNKITMGGKLAFIEGGKYLLCAGRDQSGDFARLWDLRRRTTAWSKQDEGLELELDKDGKKAQSAIWDHGRQEYVRTLPGGESAFAVSGDGKRLLTRKDKLGTYVLWDMSEPAHPREIRNIILGKDSPGVMSEDGRRLATTRREADKWKTVFWDFRHDRPPFILQSESGAGGEFFPNSRTFLCNTLDRYGAHVLCAIDLEAGEIVWEHSIGALEVSCWLLGKVRNHFCYVISPDLEHVVVLGSRHTIDVLASRTGKVLFESSFGSGRVQCVERPTFSRDGRVLLMHGVVLPDSRSKPGWLQGLIESYFPAPVPPNDGSVRVVRVVNVAARQEVFHLEKAGLHWASLSPDGRSLLVLEQGENDRDALICWDVPQPAKSWPAVLGVPAAILVLILLVRTWRRVARAKARLQPN